MASDEAFGRMADLGVVASVQPSFLTSEANWMPARLGDSPYRFASMHSAGVNMIGGSDCPVERPNPLVGITAAVHREGWNDHEHLDPATALSLFTTHDLSPGSPAIWSYSTPPPTTPPPPSWPSSTTAAVKPCPPALAGMISRFYGSPD